MGFFGDPQSPNPIPGKTPIFHFGLDLKIPGDEYRGFGIPKNPKWKIPKKSPIPGLGIVDFWGRKRANPGDRGFLSRALGIFIPEDWGFFNLGIFIPGIGDIFKSGDFHSGKWGFLKSWDFYPWNFWGWDIPPKSHPWIFTAQQILNIRSFQAHK